MDALEDFYKVSPFYAKTTYPITKVQTELLTHRTDTGSLDIHNQQYMLNHFNKRNYSVNKIVSQINPDENLLRRDTIMEETIAKIEHISKPYVLHPLLRPSTFSKGLSIKYIFLRNIWIRCANYSELSPSPSPDPSQ